MCKIIFSSLKCPSAQTEGDDQQQTSRDKGGAFLHLPSRKNSRSLGVSLLLPIKFEESMKGSREKAEERQDKGAYYDH